MVYSTLTVALCALMLLPLALAFGCQRTASSAADADGEDNSTEHQSTEHKRAANHLAGETSLYLQLHAHNPVDWYPWGEEALAKAKAEGKLIFLSIGYSSCYWCHVMERESFMDEEIAALLNEHFVCIKVDREERPDIDEIFMTALHVYFHLTRSPQGGGWPLTMFLTPDARPVMGGTYFPPRQKAGHPGLPYVLKLVQQRWEEKPQEMLQMADVMAKLVRQQLEQRPEAGSEPDGSLLDDVLASLVEQFDAAHGGFGYSSANPQVPKFPQPSNLAFLLRYAAEDRRHESSEVGRARSMLTTTLDMMARGGIYDHVGGGFHRYSTDRFWAVPHFEKMLYDNGQLASVYAEAYRLTGREDFRRVAEGILDFVLREMTDPAGGFYSAIDAETDAEEGRYYVWERDELTAALTQPEFQVLCDVYKIGGTGNFEGRHVLLLPRSLRETAKAGGTTEDALLEQLAGIHAKLLAARSQRKRPTTDTKVLTSWNGLMIRGFADAGRVFENRRYVEAAEAGARFVLDRLRLPDGRLQRTFGGGRAQLNAYLDDYAFLIDGLIALHQATGDSPWLETAGQLMQTQIDLFWDEPRGGFFFTSKDHEALLARSKDPADSALPSGNAVSAENLIYLAHAQNRPEYLDRAEKTLAAFAGQLHDAPAAMPRMAAALAVLLDARGEVPAAE
jgi:hypothetical protein